MWIKDFLRADARGTLCDLSRRACPGRPRPVQELRDLFCHLTCWHCWRSATSCGPWWMERGKLVAFVDEPTVHTWISRLLASLVDPMFPLVPRGLSKGLKPEIPSRASVPGAQPEIASKAVRED